MILVLDTTNPADVRMGISKNGKSIVREKRLRTTPRRPRLDVPNVLMHFLRAQRNSILRGVIVRDGSGTFSGVRMAIVLANSLLLSEGTAAASVQCGEGPVTLQTILARGMRILPHTKKRTYLVPRYNRAPNISRPKARRAA